MVTAVTASEIKNFLKDWEVPAKKTPVLHWLKLPNKKEQEELGVEKGHYINVFYNMYEGRSAYTLEEALSEQDYKQNAYIIYDKSSRDEYRFYISSIPQFDAVIIGMASLNCRAVTKDNYGEPRFWERRGEIVVTSNKRIFAPEYSWCWDYVRNSGTYQEISGVQEWDGIKNCFPFAISKIPSEYAGVDGEKYSELAQNMLSTFPKVVNVGANRMYDICECSWKFESFLKYKEPKKKTGPKQRKINDLISIPLRSIPYDESYADKMAFIEKVKDGMCVIRTMIKDKDNECMVDAARVYVTQKDAIGCRPDNVGGWTNMVMRSHAYNWDFTLHKFDPDVVKGTKLEYFASVVEDVPAECQGKFIQAMLSYPIIEQIAKAGLKPFVIEQFKHMSWQKPIEPFEGVFGKIDDSKKTLPEKLGMNKYQLKRIFEILNAGDEDPSAYYWHYTTYSPLPFVKRIFSENFDYDGRYYYAAESNEYVNIASIDNKTFDAVLDSLVTIREKILNDTHKDHSYYYGYVRDSDGYHANALAMLRKTYNSQVMLDMIPALVGISGEKITGINAYGYTSSDAAIKVYLDYLAVVEKLGDTQHFRPKFDETNIESIRDMHDAAVAVYNLKKDAIRAEKFGEISKGWDKWLYENDDYAIVAPKTPNDIAQEGITLHHCVKTYIDRVVNGVTNILFLRKKDDIDTPFFTIEVTNDGAVQQIHGFANRNLSTEPAAEPFVKEWIKARKMKSTNWDKVR